MANFDPKLIIFAVMGGLLPAIVWLWFWLKEDYENPEPKRIIARSFIAGGIAVFAVFILDRYLLKLLSTDISVLDQVRNLAVDFSNPKQALSVFLGSAGLFAGLAFVEETMKYVAAHISAFKNRSFDEPLDGMVYMVTAAIGFAAVENTLFLFNTLYTNGSGSFFFMTGNLRFLGATILHIVCSAIVGAAVAYSYYSKWWKKLLYILSGIFTATVLHMLFNFFIIINDGKNIFKILFILWIIAVVVIIFFEKVKVEEKNYV